MTRQKNALPWTPEEDFLLSEIVSTCGPDWAFASKKLKRRTATGIRNRFQRIREGARKLESGARVKSTCSACGGPRMGHVCQKKLGSYNFEDYASSSDESLPMRDYSFAESLRLETWNLQNYTPLWIPPKGRDLNEEDVVLNRSTGKRLPLFVYISTLLEWR